MGLNRGPQNRAARRRRWRALYPALLLSPLSASIISLTAMPVAADMPSGDEMKVQSVAGSGERDAHDHAASSDPASDRRDEAAETLSRWREAVFWGLILLLIFVVGAAAIVRFSERFRSFIGRGARRPTPSDDAWSRSKLPDALKKEYDLPDDEDR